jgi:transposase
MRATLLKPDEAATAICELLELLVKTYGPEVQRLHLIVDNDCIHSAHATRRLPDALGGRIVLHVLPPYSLDANRIERVWQDHHANVTSKHRCKTMKRLLTVARSSVNACVWRRCTGCEPVIALAA